MSMSTVEINSFLSGAHLARVATVRPDGRPHVAPVWYLWRDGEIFFETDKNSVKAKNLTHNPAIAITVDVTTGGLRLLYVILEGKVQLLQERAQTLQIAKEIYMRYVGEEGLQTPTVQDMLSRDFLIVRLRPQRILTMDQLGPHYLSAL